MVCQYIYSAISNQGKTEMSWQKCDVAQSYHFFSSFFILPIVEVPTPEFLAISAIPLFPTILIDTREIPCTLPFTLFCLDNGVHL